MATLRIGDATVGYAVEKGPSGAGGIPVLLFHGTTMDRTAWDMVRAAMPDGYEFVLFELPGSGESPMPDAPLTVDAIVDDGLALMSHLGHDRFHVGGYSLGAVLALATAGLAPERVRSVTSLCGWAAADPRMRVTFQLWKKLISIDPALFTHYALADGLTVNGLTAVEPVLDMALPVAAAAIQPGSLAHLDLDISLDITAHVAKITSPCLLIGATDDRWVDISHSRTIHEAVPGSVLAELPAGHLVIQELALDVAALMHDHITSSGVS